MWNFDLAKTKAGQELYLMGDKNGEKRGEKRGEKKTIMEEIDRIKAIKSKGVLTDSLYEEFIAPLEKKLATLETVDIRNLEHRETGTAAIS